MSHIEEQYRQETDPVARRAIVVDFVKREIDDLAHAYHQDQRFLDAMRKGLESIRSDTRAIMDTVHYRHSEVKQAKEQLKELTTDWRMEAKRKDRAESKLVAQIENGGLGDKVAAEPMAVDSNTVVQRETPENAKSPENKEQGQQVK
jgi:hypothetical protein